MSLRDLPFPSSPAFAQLKENQKQVIMGETCVDWLEKWDNDGGWTVSVGLGPEYPDYEQIIHVCVAEMLRYMISKKVEASFLPNANLWWEEIYTELNTGNSPARIILRGMSGAQYNAAKNIAYIFYCDQPINAIAKMTDLDRIIFVQNPLVHGAAIRS